MQNLLGITLLFLLQPLIPASQAGPPKPAQSKQQAEKALALINDAIAARGGAAYLNVKTSVSHGEFSPYTKGVPNIPQQFVDYIAYPDRERTEFGKGSHRFIQTNTGNTGWTYDGSGKLIKRQTLDQVKQYQQTIRYDLDNLLRHGWKEPDAKLTYLSLREVLPSTFAPGVRIDYSDGASVMIFFHQRTKLPLLTEYKVITDEGSKQEQVRFYQWIDFGGIKCPKIQDTYRAGVQTSRVYYDRYEFNVDLPDKLFELPSSVKDVK